MENRSKQIQENNISKVNTLMKNKYLSNCIGLKSLLDKSTNYWKGHDEKEEFSIPIFPNKQSTKKKKNPDCSNSDFQQSFNSESLSYKPYYESVSFVERDDKYFDEETLLLNPLNLKKEPISQMNYDMGEMISDLSIIDLNLESQKKNYNTDIAKEVLENNNNQEAFYVNSNEKTTDSNFIDQNTTLEDIKVESSYLNCNYEFLNFANDNNLLKNFDEKNSTTIHLNSTYDNSNINNITTFDDYSTTNSTLKNAKVFFKVENKKTNKKSIKMPSNVIVEQQSSQNKLPYTINNNNININLHINNYNPQFLRKKLENSKIKNEEKLQNISIDLKSLKSSALIRLVKYYKFNFENLSNLFTNTTPKEVESIYKTIIGVENSNKVRSMSELINENLGMDGLINISKNNSLKMPIVENDQERAYFDNKEFDCKNDTELLLNEDFSNKISLSSNLKENYKNFEDLKLKSAFSCSTSPLCSTACETKRYSVDDRNTNYKKIDQKNNINPSKSTIVSNPKTNSNTVFDKNQEYDNYLEGDIINSNITINKDTDKNIQITKQENIYTNNNFTINIDTNIQKEFNKNNYFNPNFKADINGSIFNYNNLKSNEPVESLRSSFKKEAKSIDTNTIRSVINSTSEIANKLKDEYIPIMKNIDFGSLGVNEIRKIGNLNSFLNDSFAKASVSFHEITNLYQKNNSVLSKYPTIVKKTLETENSLNMMINNLNIKYSKYNNIIITNLANTIQLYKSYINNEQQKTIEKTNSSETNVIISTNADKVNIDKQHQENIENNEIINFKDNLQQLNIETIINDDQKSTNSSNIFINNNEEYNKNVANYNENEDNNILNQKSSLVSQAEEEIIYLNESLINQSIKNTTSCTVSNKKSPSLKFSISLSKKLEVLSQMVHLLKLKLIWFQKIESLK